MSEIVIRALRAELEKQEMSIIGTLRRVGNLANDERWKARDRVIEAKRLLDKAAAAYDEVAKEIGKAQQSQEVRETDI